MMKTKVTHLKMVHLPRQGNDPAHAGHVHADRLEYKH